jgi:membrane fusion protein, multidrug efflux system
MKTQQMICSFLLLSLLAACKERGASQALATQVVVPLTITASDVKTERIERRIDITGSLAAWEEAVVSFEVEGRIAEVTADLGDEVARGAVLVRITPVEFAWRKAQSDAELAAAEADFKRLSEMGGKNLISQQQLDEGRRRLDVAKAAADLAEKKFSDTSLKAPFSGRIAKRLVNAGEYARAGGAALQIVNANPLKFKGDVPERYSRDVKVGDEVQAFIEASTTPLSGKIVRIAPSVAPESRSFAIEARLDNPSGAVKAGTFARLSITTKSFDDAITVPEGAIVNFAGNPRVYVIGDGVAKEQPIEVAGKSLERVLVSKGLSAGQKVATSSLELLSDGRTITVR